jgi:hypothetical protein
MREQIICKLARLTHIQEKCLSLAEPEAGLKMRFTASVAAFVMRRTSLVA